MFDKIYRCMRRLSLFVLLLFAAFALALLYTTSYTMFKTAFVATFISFFLVYAISIRIAKAATKSIMEPIKRAGEPGFSADDNIYEELKPFLSRLTSKESEIKRQSKKTKSQKLQLQTITENMNEGLIILDNSMHVLSMNHCAEDILGIRGQDIKYKSFRTIQESNLFSKGLDAAAKGENSDLIFSSIGKTYQMFFTPFFENAEVNGVVILLFDISQRQRAEQIRREFSANVSHELKTPLTTISGYSQIITKGIAKPEDVQGFAEKIEKETTRLITLIDDIIALSALEEKSAIAEREHVSLREIAKEVLDSLESRAFTQEITLHLTGSDTTVSANRRQMQELIFNLCDNAVKYNKAGGNVTVHISHNAISVSDTGIGIPPDSIDRLFERFYRVDKSHSKKVNGTGLGLSIVKHIVQNHDAEISVKSILGEGSTFTVVFKSS